MTRQASLLLAIAAAILAVALLVLGPLRQAPPPPSPVALVEPFASAAPLAGLRCSGLLVEGMLVTARHCLTGPTDVVAGSLCEDAQAVLQLDIEVENRPTEPDESDFARHVVGDGPGPGLSAPGPGEAVVTAYGLRPTDGRSGCDPVRVNGSIYPVGREGLGARNACSKGGWKGPRQATVAAP